MPTIQQQRKRQNTRTRRHSGGSTTKPTASKSTLRKKVTQWVKNNPGKAVALLAAGGLGVGAGVSAGVSEHNKRKKARIDAATYKKAKAATDMQRMIRGTLARKNVNNKQNKSFWNRIFS